MAADPVEDFRRSVEQPDDRIDLGRAALEIARDNYPNLDVAAYLRRIDQLSFSVNAQLSGSPDVYRQIAALNYILFRQEGFRGNREEYYDPRNSFLNDVIERKTGIPITLCVVYMEVARRIGLSLDGVGFPGHFLVKYTKGNEEIVIDPFNAGEVKSEKSLEKLLGDLYQEKVSLRREFLAPVTKKQILKRMLNNLKMIYWRQNDFEKALPVLRRSVIVDPTSAEDIRDRGLAYLKLECFSYALADLESYLERAPDAGDAGAIKEEIVNLTRQVRQIH